MSDYQGVKDWRSRQPDIREIRAEEARRWRAAHPEVAKAIKQRYLERSKEERLPREAMQAAIRRKKDPEGDLRRRKSFEARREARRAEIAGRPRAHECEICTESGRTVFDHCHITGDFRGWICDRCNKVLGLVKDSPELLNLLARYLGNGKVDIGREECNPHFGIRTTLTAQIPY